LAKIIVPGDAKNVQVGKLIGLLVEEKSEIASLDTSKYTGGKVEAPKSQAAPT